MEPVGAAGLAQPLTVLPGIGARRAALLERELGVRTVGELLRVFPRRYEQPAKPALLAEARDGELVQVQVTVTGCSLWRRGGGRTVLNVRLADASGAASAVYFNQPYLREAFPPGRELLLEGRASRRRGLSIYAPRVVRGGEDGAAGLQPLYPEVPGVPARVLRRAMTALLRELPEQPEPLPEELRAAAEVPVFDAALRARHAPASSAALEAARRRFAWEEVLRAERRRRTARAARRVAPLAGGAQLWERIRARLPFALSAEQEQALAVLRGDLESGSPMARLLHGEVGSGKTALAFALCLAVAAGGGQCALLAPTEILARQHLATFRRWLAGSRLRVAGLLGDDGAAARQEALAALAGGAAQLAIGTHALLGEEVRFARLELAVFDEQHRFGVRQKAALLRKGAAPHVLTMTATPIPRTLAWARYGALEPCVLRRRAAGAAPVTTRVLPAAAWPELAATLAPRLAAGERCFVVASRIDGAGGLLEQARLLLEGPWRGLSAALVHGRMSGAEVERAVADFAAGRARALLGTTVVEVGLDVPGVPLMAVLGAQRLGLASLHQLRGRLARGAAAPPGECWILAEEQAVPRLRMLETCADGFAVAAADLRERGPGALRGLRQHGKSDFSDFDPELDTGLIEALRRPEVQEWLARPEGKS